MRNLDMARYSWNSSRPRDVPVALRPTLFSRRSTENIANAGQLIVGVSEHVTYWNGLGWSDPFSSPAYTERQNPYGQRFHLDSVYTPKSWSMARSRLLAVTAPVSFEQFDRRIKCLKLAFISSLPALMATG